RRLQQGSAPAARQPDRRGEQGQDDQRQGDRNRLQELDALLRLLEVLRLDQGEAGAERAGGDAFEVRDPSRSQPLLDLVDDWTEVDDDLASLRLEPLAFTRQDVDEPLVGPPLDVRPERLEPRRGEEAL